ncbi:MAG: hypothetical protein K2L55_00220 [Muribaculaceae bacterium]|nr:hypothetical protein [Muribaculaceae bacterium]
MKRIEDACSNVTQDDTPRPGQEGVAELNFPRLIIAFGALLCKETAATKRSILTISSIVAAVSLQSKAPKAIINRGKIRMSFATPS